MGKAPLWAAVDLSGVNTSSGTISEGGVADTDYNAAYASVAMLLAEASTITFDGWAATDEYFSACFYLRLPTLPLADTSFLAVTDQTSATLVDFVLTTAGEIECYFDGVLKQTVSVSTSLARYCLRVNILDERVQLIQNNVDFIDVTALDFTGVTGFASIVFTGAVANTALSSFVCDNEDTISRYTVPLDFLAEDATYNDLVGDIANLSDRDTETGYAASAAGDITLFTHTPVSSIGGAAISCLCMTAQIGSLEGIAGVKSSLELSETVYDSADTLTASGLFSFAENPADTADWSLADINAIKYGVKAV